MPRPGLHDPIGLSFNLYKADRARAERTDPTNPYKRLPQFEQGFVINLKEHEPVSAQVRVQLPDDRITWHFEADIYTGGEKRTIVLDDNGRDFHSPGVRAYSDYDEGHFSGVVYADWGVDRAAIRVGDRLEYPGLRVPWVDGVDVHQPFPLDGQDSQDSGVPLDQTGRSPARPVQSPGGCGRSAGAGRAVDNACRIGHRADHSRRADRRRPSAGPPHRRRGVRDSVTGAVV